ncbi:MAG: AAA family ATPase [Oscillospiraceae bacterium]|nr:AAA family ATPase [Oscillospiraceae bacterium]
MACTIAVAGKGGVGKTTLCGLLIDWMCKNGKTPILAVDADANSNLNEVLGVEVETTLGDIRELVASADIVDESPIPAGMSKQDFMDIKFNRAIIEEDDYDMLVMGRTQGKGCYCFVNGLLTTELRRLSGGYKYILVDNEAGMEHISRGILPEVDVIVLVSDCSRRGIQAVGRIAQLIGEMEMKPKAVKLIVNRAPAAELAEGIKEEIRLQNLDLIGVVPQDEAVYEYDSEGKPTVTLPADSKVRLALNAIAEQLFTIV